MTLVMRFAPSLRSGGSLPADLARDMGRRAAIGALTLAGLWTLVAVLQTATAGLGGRDTTAYRTWDTLGPWLTVVVIAASVGLAFAAHRMERRADRLLLLILGYEVLVASAVAVISQWHAPVPGRGISWNSLLILLFPAIAPARPLLGMVTSLVVASTEPVVYFLAVRAGVADPPLTSHQAFWTFAPSYLCAGLAMVPAAVVRGLGARVREARELGNYRLGARIGAGGMGEVYRASHRLLARPAAVKLISAAVGAPGEELRARFRREAAAAAGLRSPHTIDLYDFGETAEGTLYYAMELLDGIDLQTLVERHGPVPPERAVHLLRQACLSLAEAHRRGFVHRDIKPSNLMACRMGTEVDFVKVLDFGLVKVASPAEPGLTLADATAGTPAYLSPEAIEGVARVDHRADLYALGCVAWWLLSGGPVFRAPSIPALLLKHGRDRPPPLTSPSGPVPAGLEALVMQCLEKDPERRPSDALELGRALAAIDLPDSWSPDRAAAWWDAHLPERGDPD